MFKASKGLPVADIPVPHPSELRLHLLTDDLLGTGFGGASAGLQPVADS